MINSKRYLYLVLFLLCVCSVSGTKYQTLTPFLADSTNNTGIAVVICPGGSYHWLDMKKEGIQTAEWLQSNGINAFVLKYSVASISAWVFWYRFFGLGHHYPDMLVDVEQALADIYTQASEYHIDTTKIGVLGFSAGGHLAMMSYAYNHTAYRPKFVGMIYPVVTMSDKDLTHVRSRRGALGVWGQFNKQMRDSLSLEKYVPADCPPVFLLNCKDDPTVPYGNSVLLDSALTAQHIPHTYISYDTGGHGFGASDSKGTNESRQWKQTYLQWILSINQ